MKTYLYSFKMLGIAILAIVVSLLWEDAAPIGFLAFIAFVLLAIVKAFEASKTLRSKLKLMAVFSTILGLMIILGFTVMNPPQCPSSYTQQQIDAANGSCIIGANIGTGLYFMFIVLPVALLLLVLWILTLLSAQTHNKNQTRN